MRTAWLIIIILLTTTACHATRPGNVSRQDVVTWAIAAEHHAHVRSAAGAEITREIGRLTGESAPGDATGAMTAAEVIAALDVALVERGLLLSIAYMFGSPLIEVEDEYRKVRAENEYVAAQAAMHSDRLVAACSVNPLRDYALDEIRRCAEDPRVGAMKLHLANSEVNLRNDAHVDRLVELFTRLARYELPAIVHVRTAHPEYGAEDARVFIEEVLAEAGGLPLQIAHMAGWGGYDDATDAALGVFAEALSDGRLDPDLVSFDLAAVVFLPEAAGADEVLANQVRRANEKLANRIREIGPERVVFATDWPSWPPTRDDRMKILQNARLIRMALPLTPAEMAVIMENANVIVTDG